MDFNKVLTEIIANIKSMIDKLLSTTAKDIVLITIAAKTGKGISK